MSSIKAIAPASGPAQAAVYAGETAEKDILAPVLCWTVIDFENKDEPDEVVGQIFDGQCVTEATSVDDEEGFGEFVGYFALTKRGRAQAAEACNAHRERIVQTAEKKPKKNKKKEKKEEVEEATDEEVEDFEGDEDDADEDGEDGEGFGGLMEDEDEEEDDEDDDDDEEEDQ